MGFDSTELDLVRTSLRHALSSTAGADTLDALIDLGWQDLVNADRAAAIATLAEEAGRSRSTVSAAGLAILATIDIAADSTTAVILDGLAPFGSETAGTFINVAADQISTVDAAAVTLTPAAGFDPALGLRRATLDADAEVVIGDRSLAEAGRAAGRLALASQMVGAVDQMLVETLIAVTDRHQYGRAIGSFQTVKHRLAEVKVAVSAARAGVAAAWDVADTADGPTVAMAAKCLAGRAQQAASTHCFQVHGGIAFTVEHGFQQWVRRGLLLDHLLGGHDRLTRELGRHLIAVGHLPRVPDLAFER